MLKLVRNNHRLVGATARLSLDLMRLPQHIAIAMDGNRRWARKRQLKRLFGHQQGVDAVKRSINAVLDLGVPYLTLYTFSIENWGRPADEVDGLMHLLDQTIRSNLDDFHSKGIRLRILGERERLNPKLLDLMDQAVEKTKSNTALTLSFALNYGGRTEIVQAAKKLAILVKEGKLEAEGITQDLLNAQMYTAGLPDPDLLIRTGNESRMSNFLLWQSAYTELVFIKTLWPDFTKNDLIESILEFQRRERRFGGNRSDDV